MAEAEKIIYVGNVCAEVDEATLRAIFENCGYVAQIRIAGKPGFNTVFCFVEFADPSHARLALAMDGFQIGERKVRVSMAKASSLEKYYEKLGTKDTRPPAAVALQARAQAKLQALQQPHLQPPQQPGFQNGHHTMNLQPQVQPPFDSHSQVVFPQNGNLLPGSSSAPPFPSGAEPSFVQNGPSVFPSICSPPYPSGGNTPFPQNGASYLRSGPPAFATPAPSPQPLHLLSHRPPSLPPPRLNPPPPIKPVANDFGRGFGSSSRQKRPHQDPEKVERTIFIESLPEAVDEQILADHFGISGEVTSVRVVSKGPGQTKAWVEFQSQQQAITAREHDQTQFGGSVIRIQPSKTAIHTNALAREKTSPTEG